MRIGIVTLSLHTNYGGILQAYAMQTILERMGHQVTMIDRGWPLKEPFPTYAKRVTKESVKKVIKQVIGRRNTPRWHWIFFPTSEMNKEHELTFQFVDKYIHRRMQRNFYDIKEGEFDGFVVGSDQIWRECFNLIIENAYLDFAEGWNVKRVAYAASFGTDAWEYSPIQTENCAKLLKKFDAVAVREKSGVTLCKKYLGCEAKHVLDPTMLLTPSDYVDKLNIAAFEQSKGNFMVYILDMTEEKQKIVDFIAQTYHLTPFYVNSKCDDKRCKIEDRIQPPVESWLRGFYDAKFVFTDSFHACAFSINFNIPFLVFGNKARGMSRFESLLSSFDLTDRMISGIADVKARGTEAIDWQKVNALLADKRAESFDYLTNSLN